MSMTGIRAPMIRGSNGFVQLKDDDLIENALQFFIGTYANQTGTAGEIPWDHKFGTPAEGLRHRNLRVGVLEWFTSVMAKRVNAYFNAVARVRAVERYSERTTLRLRIYWRNVSTEEEKPTDVQFQPA